MKKYFLLIFTVLLSFTLKAQTNLVFSGGSLKMSTGIYPLVNISTKNLDTLSFSILYNGVPIGSGYTKTNTTINGTTYPYFRTLLAAVQGYIGSVSSSGGGGDGGNVNVVTSVLPTNAAKETGGNLDAISASVAAIDAGIPVSLGQKTKSASMPVVLPSDQGNLPISDGSSLLATSAKQDAQTTALNQLHSDLIAPLPSGTNGIGKVVVTDASGNGITSSFLSGKQRLDVNLAAGGVPAATAPAWADQVAAVDGSGNLQPLQADASKNLKISDGSSLLSTLAAQVTGNGYLGTIAGNIPTKGTSVASASSPEVLASDQPLIPVSASSPSIINSPSTVSIAALNGTVQWTVQSGGNYLITLTNGPGATTAWSGTITFQYSLNNSTWNTLSVLPVSTPAAQVTTATANGLWLVQPIVTTGTSNQVVYIRANMTAYTSGTVYAALAPADKQNQKILLPWNYTVTSGQTVLGPLDASGIQAINIQISAITTTVLTAQGTNDPSFTTFNTIPVQNITTQGASSATFGAVAAYRFAPMGFKYVRIQVTTTGTVLTIQGITATLGQEIQINSFGNDIGATINAGTLPTLTTLTTVANGQTAHSSAATGSPFRSAGIVVPTTIATADQTLVAGDAANHPITTGYQLITKDFGTSELDYTFHLTSAATTVTLQQIVPASGTATIRNYITGLTLETDAIGTAGNVWVLDGQGAIGTSVTIATPGVFTSSAHDLKVGDAIVFTSLGTITGVSTNTIYYITSTSFSATTFTVATTQGGTALAITGSTSAFTFYRVLYPIRIQTTAIGAPALVTFPTPLKGIANSALNFLIPTSLTSGNLYLTFNGYRGF